MLSSLSSQTFAVFIALCILHTWALTDCSAAADNCLCVWNLILHENTQLPLNGVYHKVDSSATTSDRQWMNSDFTNGPNEFACNDQTKYFWASDVTTGYRWVLGSESNIGSGNGECFCNDYQNYPNRPFDDPRETTCPEAKYYCSDQGLQSTWINDTHPLLQDLYIEFGYCPDVTNYCSTIRITSNSQTDCDGVYDAIDPPNGLDNQINMYQNQDTSANNKYIYFDHAQWRWVCATVYDPCREWPTGIIIYKGDKHDAGTPDFTTIRNTGETWTVSKWGNLGVPTSSIATFECNPALPTPQPTTYQPTSDTGNPSVSPTQYPSKYPTVDPSVSPTRYPSVNPSVSPSKNPIGSPSRSPSANPSITPSRHPSVSPTRTRNPTRPPSVSPTRYPSVNPTVSPTNNPSVPPSVSPTGNPTVTPTRYPTKPGETWNPTGSPSVRPTNVPTRDTNAPSRTPSRTPLGGDITYPPVTARPTGDPSVNPSVSPTNNPSGTPSVSPTGNPSVTPTVTPTRYPTKPGDTLNPTASPSVRPTEVPTRDTSAPSRTPLVGDSTYAPVTASPTDPLPTPKPTKLTYTPTAVPTTTVADEPTTAMPTTTTQRSDASLVMAPCLSTILVFIVYFVFV